MVTALAKLRTSERTRHAC